MTKRTALGKVGTAVLGMAIVGTTVGGFVGASSVSAAQARHRAAVAAARAKAAEDKARADYASAVQGVAADVLATLQPMEQVLHGLDDFRPGVIVAIQDAFTGAGVGPQLAQDVTRLQAIHAPASVSSDASDLVRRAGDLQASFVALVGAVGHSTDKALFDVLTGTKVDALRDAEAGWQSSLAILYSHLHATTPGAPSATGTWTGPATKATWIARADEACGQAGYTLNRLPHGKDLGSGVRFEAGWSAATKRLARDLRGIPLPAADATHLKTAVLDHLGVLDSAARDGAAASRDMKAHSFQGALDDFDRIDADMALLKPLSRGFRSYGATLCANFFTVGKGNGGGSGGASSSNGLST